MTVRILAVCGNGQGSSMMFGSIPQQDVFQRVQSSKTERIAIWASVLGGVLYFLFAFVPMTAPLEVRHLTKRYGDFTAVDDLSFAVPPGICFGLLGPNGAGKTTTLRCCLGLTAPDGGELRLNGLAVPERAREARRATGVVPQFDNLDPDFTVAENLLVFGRYFGLEDRLIRSRIPDLLEFAGLGGKGDAPLKSLSGGMGTGLGEVDQGVTLVQEAGQAIQEIRSGAHQVVEAVGKLSSTLTAG